jgi:TolB-like protein/Flp pilus assembly protein TadD
MSGLWERLRQRKLVQWGLAYLAGAWVALQVLGQIGQNFGWSSLVMRQTTVALGFGVLPVLVLAYYHGDRGEQRVRAPELLILGALLALGGGAVRLASVSDAGAPSAATSPSSPDVRASVAVLPFDNLSSNPENAYFADGMMEDILTQLSQIGGLRVIARTSVQGYRKTTKPLREIGRELGVEHVVEGSVRRQGNQVRITAELVQVSTEEHLWARSFDRELTDVFAVQSEISRQIAEQLRVRLSEAEQARLERKPTENPIAYDLYLRGRQQSQVQRDGNERAIVLYSKALELDPSFAAAEADLGSAYTNRSYRFGAGREWADSGLARARHAIRLDPGLAAGYNTLGSALGTLGQQEQAHAAHLKAFELDPNNVGVINNLGADAGRNGDAAEALRWFTRAVRLNPQGVIPYNNVLFARLRLGDFTGAKEVIQTRMQRFPEQDGDLVSAYLALAQGDRQAAARLVRVAVQRPDFTVFARAGAILLYSGQVKEAAPLLERAVSDRILRTIQTPDADVLLGYARLRLGDRAGAERLFQSALSGKVFRVEETPQSREYMRASIAAARGQREEALQALERAVEAGWRNYWIERHDPIFDGLRGDARYQALMGRVRAELDRQREEVRREGRS